MEIADDENSQMLYLEFLNNKKKIPLSSCTLVLDILCMVRKDMFKWNKKIF